ncbi:MAG TPA: class I SAM-dependent methyltransferase [Streptosporangiaceae bacterium]|jgi:SAM-dependent methyltransferase|nr:class I SAM-dependent methyltransferase [Streptosporangiaceae bacterium]
MTDPAASSVQAAYDAIARAYDAQFASELDAKPLDRGLLAAFLDLAGEGTVADVGCGPGHVTRFLAARHHGVTGIDLSPGMIAAARERAPELDFTVGSMLRLPVTDGAWAGAIALYSIIHLTTAQRATACKEFARAIRPGGWLLIAFHIDSADFAAGEVNHITTWFGEPVQIDGYFLDPAEVTRDLEAAGFSVMATTVRQPWPGIEYPSRRCYLLAQRPG